MEHTHLVKGLDYALLQKVRQVNWSKGASLAPCLSVCLSICHSSVCLDHLCLAVVCLLVCLFICLSVCLSQVRSEIQLHQREVEEVHLQEKRVERERAKVEFEEDISFKTKMGVYHRCSETLCMSSSSVGPSILVWVSKWV